MTFYWNVSLFEISEPPTLCAFCHRNWQSFQFHHADFSFFHPALIQQDNRPLQSCLAEHFTFTACCYLLILATLLLSIAFHLSFISFNHAHATTFFSLYFLSPALSRKQFTCQAEGSMQLPGLRCDGVRACACVCVWGIATLAEMLSITLLEHDLWLAAVGAILRLNRNIFA